VLEQFHFRPWRDDVQRVALGVAENEPSARREQFLGRFASSSNSCAKEVERRPMFFSP